MEESNSACNRVSEGVITRESDLFNFEYDYRRNWTSQKSCYQLIMTSTISEKTNAFLFHCLMLQIFSVWKIPSLYRVGGCCKGYCYKFCDWWVKLSALNTIGRCPITANCPILLSDYNSTQ